MVLMAFAACKDKKQVQLPQPITNEPELITTLILQMSDSAAPATKIMVSFRDPDGSGGIQPVISDTLRMAKGKTYFASIVLLDETKMPVDTISKEVLKEADDHQLFFNVDGTPISVSYRDKDSKNLPVGLVTRWRTENIGTGSVKITLKHQAGTKDGNMGTGETDAEVTFKTKINN